MAFNDKNHSLFTIAFTSKLSLRYLLLMLFQTRAIFALIAKDLSQAHAYANSMVI